MDIHRCRFVQYPPSAINALAFSHSSHVSTSRTPPSTPTTLRLALGRPNGDVEIWNPSSGLWYQESILRGGKDRSIEGLVWVQDPEDFDKQGYRIPGMLRLFSIGYSTSVTEWDLAEGKPRRHSGGNYGEIWCMAVQPKPPIKTGKHVISEGEEEAETQSIAVGCADGAIVLLSTADHDLRFTKLVARSSKKRARVLSLAFQSRFIVVAGHADSTIRVYDIRNGQQLRNVTLGAGPKGGPKETLVWSVRCFSDGSIVSGDSTGTMCFWDSKTYALVQRIQAHEADILDVAVSADGQSVFSGGMDRRTVCYKRSGGGKPDMHSRWAKVSHSRLHKHDVKAMATFESKSLSIVASGGLDTNPILLPIQQFGKEHHRTLSSLPQQPCLLSVPRRRLVVSWWDREISIWAVPRRQVHEAHKKESSAPCTVQGRRLVAKFILAGDESITSVTVAPTGNLLAVSTVASTKVFQLLPRKDGTLRVQKSAMPPSVAQSGAKLVQFSPDSKWLCLVLVADKIRLHWLGPQKPETAQASPSSPIDPIKLDRLPRPDTRLKAEDGTLGDYHRSINRIAFSADSTILAVSDLSGYLDTWVLEGYEDQTQASSSSNAEPQNSASSSSSDSSSDSASDSDEESPPLNIYGQHWTRNPSASLLPKLPSQPLVLSFRPSSTTTPTTKLPLADTSTPPTNPHTPQSHSHVLPAKEDRLLAITTGNRILEFHTLTGCLTDWSRRNPASVFPEKFRGLMDQAKGLVWDVGQGGRSRSSRYGVNGSSSRERCWIYGVNWLWMFDLAQDLQPRQRLEGVEKNGPSPPPPPHHKALVNGGDDVIVNGDSDAMHPSTKTKLKTAMPKRKRALADRDEDDDDDNFSYKTTTGIHGTAGAGGLIPMSQLNIGLGRKMRRIDGAGERDGEAMKVKVVNLDTRTRRREGSGGEEGGEEYRDDDDDDDDGDDDNDQEEDEDQDEDVDTDTDVDVDTDVAVNESSALVRMRREEGQPGGGGRGKTANNISSSTSNSDADEVGAGENEGSQDEDAEGEGEDEDKKEDHDATTVTATATTAADKVLPHGTMAINHSTPLEQKQQQQQKQQQLAIAKGKAKKQTRPSPQPAYWFTFKYRPILGIVPLGSPPEKRAGRKSGGGGGGDRGVGGGQMDAGMEEEEDGEEVDVDYNDDEGEEDDEEGEGGAGGIEVAVVERPLWEVDLPARFYGAREWGRSD